MKKETTSQRLKHLMLIRKIRQIDILNAALPYAEKYGIKLNRSDISQYVSGKVEPGQDKLAVLGEALNINPVWLLGYDVPMEPGRFTNGAKTYDYPDAIPITTRRIPIIGSVACGEPIYSPEFFGATMAVGYDIECDFALRCKGDSMINARIYDGDIVFIRKQDSIEDGEIAAVSLDGEATLKRIYRLADGRIELRAENPKYKSIIVGGENETRTFYVMGKAVAFQSVVF